ncbi:MAG TPA: nitroreductase family protein [Terriglobia bacterium]|nr:nitroreductase family protein [Terriglobia bacterium]
MNAMNFFDLISFRHSVRAFKKDPVESEKLHKILEASNSAPSAGNLQAYEVYLVTDPFHKSALARAALEQEFIATAPLVLIFCQHAARSSRRYKERGEFLYSLQDATIACTFAMLAVTDLGLGTVWVGAFNDQEISQVLQLPEGLRPVAMLPIGYPAESPGLTTRRGLTDLVHCVEPQDVRKE